MNRYLSAIIFIVAFANATHAQTENTVSIPIDGITNAAQVVDLFKRTYTGYQDKYTQFKVNTSLIFEKQKCQRLADSLKVKPYEKVDVDGNGYTDLLITSNWYGHHIYCILDFGEKGYSVERLTRKYRECSFPFVVKKDSATYLNYVGLRERNWIDNDTLENVESKNLIYKFDNFIEYNPNPSKQDIRSITYQATGCLGSCPTFKLIINQDRSAYYDASYYSKKEGKFKTTLDAVKLKEIHDLVNYIDFAHLNDNYEIRATDHATSTTTINYANGQIKRIVDYGQLGTYGLTALYKKLFALTESQVWH
ncbi:hypothetical protein J2I47_18745 [Fibrella sp. HMF5335]|uniref:DUF6438 domain-containing protein n=1 Tax=Fibrella rubiginis TaxID=2817060 RepID=A0A939GLI7_9BACT|nr:DUF6438 domain-containing protein [Fibrella rubiginis]MBO0938598.1 hypothetical protein [Fibrella rubiginis]